MNTPKEKKMNLTSTKERLSQQATTANVLGELLWWSMRNVEILQETVEKIVDDLEITDPVSGKRIESKDVCPQLQARGGLRKALEDLNIRSGSARKTVKASPAHGLGDRVILARRLDCTDDASLEAGAFSIVLVEETIGERAKVSWSEVQRVTYRPSTKSLGFTTELLVDEIRRGFRHYGQTYSAPEASRVLHSLIDRAHGLVARESGGVYFLPRQTMGIGEVLDKIAAQIPGASVTRWPVLDAGEGEQVRETAEFAGKALRGELATLAQDIGDLQKRIQDPSEKTPKGSTVRRRIDAFKTLKHKAQTYRDLLGMQDEAVKKGINALSKAAKALAMGA